MIELESHDSRDSGNDRNAAEKAEKRSGHGSADANGGQSNDSDPAGSEDSSAIILNKD